MTLVNVKLIEVVFAPTQKQANIRRLTGTIRLATPVAVALFAFLGGSSLLTAEHKDHERISSSPADAVKSPPEKLAYDTRSW